LITDESMGNRNSDRLRLGGMSWIRVVIAAALCTTGCAGGQPPAAPPSPAPAAPDSATHEGERRADTVSVGCGESIGASGPVKMTGEFPATTTPDQFTGKVIILAGTAKISGVSTPGADVYLARDGKIVSVPLPKDLVGRQVDIEPGGSTAFDAPGSARDCATDGQLTPGRYEIYARIVLTSADGSSMEATGGPWPLAVAAE
jgi:hypothetical protein